jgi:hypothetical protein
MAQINLNAMPPCKANRGGIRAKILEVYSAIVQRRCGTFGIEGDVLRRPSISYRGDAMRKALTALAAAATIAAVAVPTTADARRGWRGPGIVGGFAAGAIVASAFARPYGYGGYFNYYQPAPVYYDYYAPAPLYYDYAAPQPYYGCWRWRYGYRYRVC